MKAVIKSCSCAHKYQDSAYGKGNRVMNLIAKLTSAKCTVCGAEKAVAMESKKK